MEPLIIYTSLPGSAQLATLLRDLESTTGPRPVVIQPWSEIPAPDPDRCQRLRVEQAELEESIQEAEYLLQGYQTRRLQPDAGRENGLIADWNALTTRLRAVKAILRRQKGGPANG